VTGSNMCLRLINICFKQLGGTSVPPSYTDPI